MNGHAYVTEDSVNKTRYYKTRHYGTPSNVEIYAAL